MTRELIKEATKKIAMGYASEKAFKSHPGEGVPKALGNKGKITKAIKKMSENPGKY